MPHHTPLVGENSTTSFNVWKDENLGARGLLEGGGTIFGNTDNKSALGTVTSVNMSGITKSMLGCSMTNKTVFYLVIEDTIVPILSISSKDAFTDWFSSIISMPAAWSSF